MRTAKGANKSGCVLGKEHHLTGFWCWTELGRAEGIQKFPHHYNGG
jgi:hypothetical protein